MFKGDLINTITAMQILGVSRPTFDRYRSEFSLSKFRIGRTLFFSKLEVLERVYTKTFPIVEKIEFCFGRKLDFNLLKIDDTSYDLRKISLMDGHGAIAFICHLESRIRIENCYLHLVFDENNALLKSFNFFGAIRSYLNSKIFWNDLRLVQLTEPNFSQWMKLPITKLGFVGAQEKITNDLTAQLARQGYSEDVCGYIGWAMGELSDNASTHAGVHPCFVQMTQLGDDRKFLLFTIGDTGKGIPTSLKENSKYANFSDEELLLMAFKPYVSGRSDDEARGKGLTDVLKIAMECSSVLWVESNGIGYTFRFNAGIDNFEKNEPLVKSTGTIISLLFIDGNFSSYKRQDVANYVDVCLGAL